MKPSHEQSGTDILMAILGLLIKSHEQVVHISLTEAAAVLCFFIVFFLCVSLKVGRVTL